MRTALQVAILTFVFVLLGCGGGGGGTTVTETTVKFSVNWGERSRAFGGPSSALSMVLRITGAGVPNGDFLYSVNRDADITAHTSNYTSGPKARSGNYTVTATFYADVNSGGDVVGVATGPMTVNKDGTLSGSISTAGTIASVQVAAGQSVGAGETKQLDFTTRDSGGGLIAVSPGSAIWSVVSDSDKLTFENGYAKGLIVGSATAIATVDGIASAAGSVSVTANPNISVAVTPQAPVVLPNGTQQFTATVSGTSNQNVTWSVLTANGGSIDGNGLYTAPGTIMYATVEARSVADPSKAQTALVTVQSSTLTVTVTPNPARVSPNGTQQFAAVVDGSPNQAVTWSVVEAGGGSIDGAGLYVAPGTDGTYTVKATSEADPSSSGTTSAQVHVMIALATERPNTTYGIFVMNADGSGLERLTAIDGGDWTPDWSPDGSKIAFTRGRNPGNDTMYVINADGTGLHRVAENAYEPAWSPDGTKIAFRTGGGGYHICVISPDGTGQTQLTFDGSNYAPAWSSDGTKIAYSHNGDIFVMNADGGGKTNLTNSSSWENYPTWSPDGSRVAFASDLNFNTDIYVMNSNGSGVSRLTTDLALDIDPDWSPDGTRIAFMSTRDGNWEIYVMNPDASEQTNITNSIFDDWHPAWRP